MIDAYKEVLNYSIWRKLFEIKDYNYIHYDEMTFDFEEIQKFYRRNISYRELFDRRNPPPSYKITKRKSELDLKISTRKKGIKVKKELTALPYLSLSSLKKDDQPDAEFRV